MANLFKRRGSIGALARNHERESELLARIEQRIDTGDEPSCVPTAASRRCPRRRLRTSH